MSWTVELTTKAEKQLKELPAKFRPPVQRAIEAMESDPFAGNVKPFKVRSGKESIEDVRASIALFLKRCIGSALSG